MYIRAGEVKMDKVFQRKKSGIFLDDGCRNSGVLSWVRILEYSSNVELVLLDRNDLCEQKLSELDLLLCPGGWSRRQLEVMGETGRNAVCNYIYSGGAYLGICAGAFNVMNRPGRLQLIPFDWLPERDCETAMLTTELTSVGKSVLNIDQLRYKVRYAAGPVMISAPLTGGAEFEVLAVYKSSVSPQDHAPYDFLDTPAIVRGKYGKGTIVAVSFHPESNESTYELACACVHAASGVEIEPCFPVKEARPVRAGFMSHSTITPQCARELLELEKNRKIDVKLINNADLDAGVLNHVDVLIVPDGNPEVNGKLFLPEFRQKQLDRFIRNGGIIISSGNGAWSLGNFPQTRVPAGEYFSSAVTDCFKM